METDINDFSSIILQNFYLSSGKLKKTVLIVGGLTFIISAVVNIAFALPIGIYVCHCVSKYI